MDKRSLGRFGEQQAAERRFFVDIAREKDII